MRLDRFGNVFISVISMSTTTCTCSKSTNANLVASRMRSSLTRSHIIYRPHCHSRSKTMMHFDSQDNDENVCVFETFGVMFIFVSLSNHAHLAPSIRPRRFSYSWPWNYPVREWGIMNLRTIQVRIVVVMQAQLYSWDDRVVPPNEYLVDVWSTKSSVHIPKRGSLLLRATGTSQRDPIRVFCWSKLKSIFRASYDFAALRRSCHHTVCLPSVCSGVHCCQTVHDIPVVTIEHFGNVTRRFRICNDLDLCLPISRHIEVHDSSLQRGQMARHQLRT